MSSVCSLTLASYCYTVNLCSSVEIIWINRTWTDQKLAFVTYYFLQQSKMQFSDCSRETEIIRKARILNKSYERDESCLLSLCAGFGEVWMCPTVRRVLSPSTPSTDSRRSCSTSPPSCPSPRETRSRWAAPNIDKPSGESNIHDSAQHSTAA